MSTATQRAYAAPNGYTQIPIAKVFGDGVAAFSLAQVQQSSQSTVLTTQYGIANRFEVGIDDQTAPAAQSTFLANAKLLLAHRPGRLPDIACGLQNLATGQKAVPYVVATTQPSATGFSIGLICTTETDRVHPMGGLAYNLSPTLQIVTDYVAGSANYGTLGFISALTKTLTLNLAYARPNRSKESPSGYVLNLAYTFHLKGAGASQPGTASKNPTPGTAGTAGK